MIEILPVQRLNEKAVLPKYAKEGDAGLDLTVNRVAWENDAQICYGFGISIELPHGYVGLVYPRSSIKNYHLALSNSVGVIDSSYRGEILAIFTKLRKKGAAVYKVGDKAAQLVVTPIPMMFVIEQDKLSATDRGATGFGSSGE